MENTIPSGDPEAQTLIPVYKNGNGRENTSDKREGDSESQMKTLSFGSALW